MAWCAQIVCNLSEDREARPVSIEYLVHDRDDRFGSVFNEVFKAEATAVFRMPWRAPKAKPYAERFVRTERNECLDRIMILNERRLDRVVKTYVDHYNRERPHRGLELRPPDGWPPTPVDAPSAIERRDRIGGLLDEYCRKTT
jgi:Integrase core domain